MASMAMALGREGRLEPRMSGGSSEEARLVQAARAGDRTAFGTLHGLYAGFVHGIVLARVPRAEAADLVQDVFVTALRQIHTLRDNGAFGPWIARIARNRATDFHRRTRPVVELDEELAGPSCSEADLEAARVLAAVRTLPEAYRETLMLRLVEGLSGPEIAEKTGMTSASVRVNLHRGMKQLREKLGWETTDEPQ
jgi:RNA polymerase sigma-70 factor (ECF subfamily)